MNELLERLKAPLSAGVFLNLAELITVLNVQRKEAADLLESQDALLREAGEMLRRALANTFDVVEDAEYRECLAFLAKLEARK